MIKIFSPLPSATKPSTLTKNHLDSAYLRPMCFYGSEGMGLRADGLKVHTIIAALTNILPNRNYSAILATLKITSHALGVYIALLFTAASSSDAKNPRSAKTSSPLDSLYIYPDIRVISLSETLPPHPFEIKLTAPDGVKRA
jgi:hypothetical protein